VNPNFPPGLRVLGGAYASGEKYDEALATIERLRAIAPNLGDWGLGYTYARMGRTDEAREVAARLAETAGPKDLLALGGIHAALGDTDEALRWFGAAHDRHVDWFPWIATSGTNDLSAAVEPMRDDPRFRALVDPLEIRRPKS